MAKIYQFPTPIPMTNGNYPQFKFAVFGDSLSTVTTAGYLNTYSSEAGLPLSNADVIMTLYNFNQQTNTGSFAILTVSVASSTGQITLADWAGGGSTQLPTIAYNAAYFVDTMGTLTSAALPFGTPMNVPGELTAQAQIFSGAGYAIGSFATASGGALEMVASPNAGFFVVSITNASFGQQSQISIPDPGQSTANFVIAPNALVNGHLVSASGTTGLVQDSGIASTNLMTLSGTNTMTGSGSIVAVKANGTESANAVTASGMSGKITTSSLTTAGGSSYAITWTNTFITSTSTVLLTIAGGTNTTENITLKCVPGSSTATLTIYNNTAATALNGTIIISYLVM